VSGGIVGLLGPNGAGKSTLIKLITGLLRPSRGEVRVFGQHAFAATEARRRLGYCPEHDGLYDELTALEFVTALARLSGVPAGRARDAAARSLDQVGLAAAMNRRLRGFSKGMRQRTKLAQAMVHDPELILLDEPLTGVDPVARTQIQAQVRALGAGGKTVIVSSHVLHEIEALTEEIVVIHRGQILAEGNIYRIRQLIDRHPHRIRVECDRPRAFAGAVAQAEHISRLSFDEGAIEIETRNPDRCYDLIADAAIEGGFAIRSLTSPDNNLSAVFSYLTDGKGAM
jgi:ABC-2 type transport system ATP-binding protein